MDYCDMIQAHRERNADLTIGCIPVPLTETRHFGIVQTDDEQRVLGFAEKPATADPMPGEASLALGSMGIYVFKTRVLFEQLCEDAARIGSEHDFGKDVIPKMVREGLRVIAHRFRDRNGKATPYWRDVGTLDALYQANLDLVAAEPVLNLYDPEWPVRTFVPQMPPPKFVHSAEGLPGQARRGEAHDSLIGPGCIVSGGQVHRSILSPGVRVNSYAVVADSILFDRVDIGRYCRIRRVIIDKDVKLPPYTVLGYDREHDRARGFTITEQGIVIVAKSEPPESFQAPNPLPF
jgi:glucose-1-phosphate adenylyltransferase